MGNRIPLLLITCVGAAAAAMVLLGGGSQKQKGSGSQAPAETPAHEEPADPPPPAEVAIGERLFLETRFAHYLAAHAVDANTALPSGDPVVRKTVTTTGDLPGPFAGQSISCGACHLVDQQKEAAGMRAYNDFARLSPIPAREDGTALTSRHSPQMVGAFLPRDGGMLLHFDGEFASAEDLVVATLSGRNFGWLPNESAQAIAHIAKVIREDDGTGELAQEFGGAYAKVLAGVDSQLPQELVLPTAYRIDVSQATDKAVVAAVAKLITAYMNDLKFEGTSPYDIFLKINGLPESPDKGETPLAYGRRLRRLLNDAAILKFVAPDKTHQFKLHKQAFAFGEQELAGLKIFLREPASDADAKNATGVGNCIACHTPPNFTDFGLHNTGVTQRHYDDTHGEGAFAKLNIPELAKRNAAHDRFLPATNQHPRAAGPFRQVPSKAHPAHADLGSWNIFGNADFPKPQSALQHYLRAIDGHPSASDAGLLARSIATFKTPGLRDLGHSAPFMHNGQFDTVEDVISFYIDAAEQARQGLLRNADPRMSAVSLTAADNPALAAFIRSLNEDYE